MKTRELSLAGFVLAAFGASIAACSAQGTTAAPEPADPSAGSPPLSSAGTRTVLGGGAGGGSSAGAPASNGGATVTHGGATGTAGSGNTTSFGGAPAAAGASQGAAGAATSGVCVSAVGTAAEPAIDDFEDGDGSLLPMGSRKGFWYTFNDGSPGATQVPTSSAANPFLPVAGGYPTTSKYTAKTSGPATFVTWGAGIGVYFNKPADITCAYDGSAYSGIKFWAKSTAALKAMVQIPATTSPTNANDAATCVSSTTCNDHFYIPVTATTAWTQYTITFADSTTFKQEGWGVPKVMTFDKAHLLGMQFQVAKATAFDFSIDELTFF